VTKWTKTVKQNIERLGRYRRCTCGRRKKEGQGRHKTVHTQLRHSIHTSQYEEDMELQFVIYCEHYKHI
jgi:hypothetical protein